MRYRRECRRNGVERRANALSSVGGYITLTHRVIFDRVLIRKVATPVNDGGPAVADSARDGGCPARVDTISNSRSLNPAGRKKNEIERLRAETAAIFLAADRLRIIARK